MNFLLVAAAVFELQLPIICGPTNNILEGLRKRFNEEIVFISPSKNEIGEDLAHSLWVNTQNETWSFIVVNKDKETACIISSGDKFGTFQPDGTQT